jgi:hypothetical protein
VILMQSPVQINSESGQACCGPSRPTAPAERLQCQRSGSPIDESVPNRVLCDRGTAYDGADKPSRSLNDLIPAEES